MLQPGRTATEGFARFRRRPGNDLNDPGTRVSVKCVYIKPVQALILASESCVDQGLNSRATRARQANVEILNFSC